MSGHGLPVKMKVMVKLWIWKVVVDSDMNRSGGFDVGVEIGATTFKFR